MSPDHTHQPSTFALHQQPFLYLTASLLAGIFADRQGGWDTNLATCPLIASLIITLIGLRYRRSRLTTTALLLGCLASGAALSQTERQNHSPTQLKSLYESNLFTADDPVEVTGWLRLPPEPAPEACFLDLEVEQLKARGNLYLTSGRVWLFLPLPEQSSDSQFETLRLDYGMRLRILVRLSLARSYQNPGTAPFNQFLEQRGYDLRGTVKSALLIETMGQRAETSVLRVLYRARLQIMQRLDLYFRPPVSGTLKAMLMGNRYFLDAEVTERLRESSTYHILSISGMHVAIFAWLLLAGWLPQRKRLFHCLLTLLLLWLYAVMVGLAAPVTRATVMITTAIIAPLLFRRAISLNTLSLAAFVMLAWQPSLLADPGFQMSFIAVAAIVSLALPLIETLHRIGAWQPNSATPHPPNCSKSLKTISEILFWDERGFQKERSLSSIRYRLDKSPLARWLNRWRVQHLVKLFFTLLIVSVAIQLASLPLSCFYFNRLSPIGILLNPATGILSGILMVCGIVATLLGWVHESIVWASGWCATLSHNWLVNQITPFRFLPAATFRVAHYEGWQTVLYSLFYVPLVALSWQLYRWQPIDMRNPLARKWQTHQRPIHSQGESLTVKPARRKSIALALLWAVALFASAFMLINPPTPKATGKLTIHFLDVGQGDCALVIFPQGATMLIDAGGDTAARRSAQENRGTDHPSDFEAASAEQGQEFSIGERVISRCLWAMKLTRVDYLLATHADADHISGFADIAKNFSVGQLILAQPTTTDAESFRELIVALEKQQAPTTIVQARENFDLQGVRLEILSPDPLTSALQLSDNNRSIVVHLRFGVSSFLFTGDIERPAEALLLQSGFDLRADVLKVPHHGSKTSSSQIFLEAVRPQWAIVSAGERNPYGHPHKEVLERYRQLGATILETARMGRITVETDGATIGVRTFQSPTQ